MKIDVLSSLSPKILRIVKSIGSLADQNRVQAYLVGGFVRDRFLKRPNFDIDIVLTCDAVDFAKSWVRSSKVSKFAVLNSYPQFGTVTLENDRGLKVDLASARREIYSHPGALPQVSRGNIRDDLFRRDFSINAMAVSINHDSWGNLLDEFQGLKDLRAGRVRVLYDLSFIDDPTRILRAVRFEQRFGFQLEPQTLRLLKAAIRKNAMSTVKPPRYFEEFKKVLTEAPHPARCLRRLRELNLLGFLGNRKPKYPQVLKDIPRVAKTLALFCDQYPQRGDIETWLVYLMPLVMDVPKGALVPTLERFQLSREEKKKIFSFWDFWNTIGKIYRKKLSIREEYRILKDLSSEGLVVLGAISQRPCRLAVERYLRDLDGVELSINGDDLNALGLSPGKGMGDILEEILLQKLEGKIRSRKDEIQLAKSLISI